MKPLLQATIGLIGRVRVVESRGPIERARQRDLFRSKEARVVSLGRNLVVDQGLAMTAYLIGFGRVPGMTIGGQTIGVLNLRITGMHFGNPASPGTPALGNTSLDGPVFHKDTNPSVNQGATNHTVKYSGVIPPDVFVGKIVTEAGLFLTTPGDDKMVARILLEPFVIAAAQTYTTDWDITVTSTLT